jgi:hypothetical protein
VRDTDTNQERPERELDQQKDQEERIPRGRDETENETEGERDDEAGREPYLKPEQPW